MQKSTKVKLILKRILPMYVFKFIKSTYAKRIHPITLYRFKLKVRSFKTPEYVNLKYRSANFLILLDPKNGLVDTSIYANRTYEPHILAAMFENIKPNDTILDIGANIGHHSLYMSRLGNTSVKVIAYEPIPKIYGSAASILFC